MLGYLKTDPNVHICLRSGPPSLTISLSVKYPSFFDDSPEDWENVHLESWIKTLKIGLIKIGELLITSSKGLCVDDAQGEGWLGLKLKMNSKTKDVRNLPTQDLRILNFQCKTIHKSTNSNILASSESTSVWSLCSKAVNSKMSKNTKSTISPWGQFKSPLWLRIVNFPDCQDIDGRSELTLYQMQEALCNVLCYIDGYL